MTLPYLETDRALLNALGTETGCEVCGSDSPHTAVERERKGLLARVAELEREHADHVAAAAEAERLRAAAEERAREIDMRLKMEVPSEKQRLLQQQEVRGLIGWCADVCFTLRRSKLGYLDGVGC